jgi:hypothetical protein
MESRRLFFNTFIRLFFSNTHDNNPSKLYIHPTRALQCTYKCTKQDTLAAFEPTIFSSSGGRDDRDAVSPGLCLL